jgi:TolB-like protein
MKWRACILSTAFLAFVILTSLDCAAVAISSGEAFVGAATPAPRAAIISPSNPATPKHPTGKKKRIAVLDFRNPAGLKNQEIDYLTDLIRGVARDALPRHQYILMTKENIQDMLPPGKNLAECEGECEVETGRAIGADYLVTGEVLSFGGQLRLSMKLYDVTTGDLLSSKRAKATKVLELETPVEQKVKAMLSVLPGSI